MTGAGVLGGGAGAGAGAESVAAGAGAAVVVTVTVTVPGELAVPADEGPGEPGEDPGLVPAGTPEAPADAVRVAAAG
jgi:hypothetical protein